MTDTSTQAVKALLEGVTPGPWTQAVVDFEEGPDRHIWHQADEDTQMPVAFPCGGTIETANARFIAASRELVPALLSERDAKREALRVIVEIACHPESGLCDEDRDFIAELAALEATS